MFTKQSFRKTKIAPAQPALQQDLTPNVPDIMWLSCTSCKATLLRSDLEEALMVCPKCDYHFRMSAKDRIFTTVDENSFEEWDAGLAPVNPLNFPDYEKKVTKAQNDSTLKEGVYCGKATIEGYPCAIFAMDPTYMMGSMGSALGEKISRLFERATEQNLPVVAFTLSGGARMQEGILSLMQMAKTCGAVGKHSQEGLLYITVLTDPTTGGVTASFAMVGDIHLSEPNALIGFAGARVIEQTIRQKLPPGFQRAEMLLDKGFVDAIVHRHELRLTLAKLLALHGGVAV